MNQIASAANPRIIPKPYISILQPSPLIVIFIWLFHYSLVNSDKSNFIFRFCDYDSLFMVFCGNGFPLRDSINIDNISVHINKVCFRKHNSDIH